MKLFAAVLALTSASLSTLVRGELCVPEQLFTKLSFANAKVADDDNSLHIKGGSMLIKNVGEFENEQLNMRIKADEDYYKIAKVWKKRETEGPKPKERNPLEMNGVSGEFVNINIQTIGGDADSGKATFTFCIENENGENQELENFDIAVYDLDMRGTGDDRAHEAMIVKGLGVDGFSQASVTINTELDMYCNNKDETYPDCTELVFHSTTLGKGDDNPGKLGKTVDDLTDQQMNRSVLLWYKKTACFSISYQHYCPNDELDEADENFGDCPDYQGGNFQFAGYSKTLTDNTVCPDPPPTSEPTEEPTDSPTEEPTDSPTKEPTVSPTKEPTVSPTKEPTDSPTKEPTDSPTKEPTVSPTKEPTVSPTKMPLTIETKVDTLEPTGSILASPPVPDNCYTKETLYELNFSASTLVNNTLHLQGGELRYGGIGAYGDVDLDLVVKADVDYSNIAGVWSEREKDEKKNGLNGHFGVINLQTVKGKPNSGKGTFEFCIINSKTNAKVELPAFAFTAYDADERGEYAKEKLSIDTSLYESYSLSENTTIDVSSVDGQTVFHSTVDGVGSDNPSDLDALTLLQLKRSVGFVFKNKSCFTFTYNHYCPNDQLDELDNNFSKGCKSFAGGNFLFAGNSKSIVEEQICQTNPPTAEPTGAPTPEPTAATLSPTDTPSKPYSAAPPVSFKSPTEVPTAAPECPSKIKVLKTHGDLDIGIAGAIEIVDTSYDLANPKDTTVTVALTNNWKTQVDTIYYQYKKDHFNEKCYNSTQVDTGVTYSNITIQCHVTKPYATFELCLGDDNSSIFNEDAENAIVPQCCHAKDHKFSACFNLYIWCTEQCPAEEESVNRNRRGLRGKEGKQ